MALELNGTTGVSLVQDGVVVAANLNSALSDTIALKAWVNFNGTTNTGGNCDIRASYNVSSVTDIGTGDFTVNFTTAISDVNYCATFSAGKNSADQYNTTNSVTQTTTTLRVQNSNLGASLLDNANMFVSIFR